MRRLFVFTMLFACTVNASAQQASIQPRAQEIADAFAKFKHVVKEKHGLPFEKYKDLRSAPVARHEVASYSGIYEVPELGYELSVRVGVDGNVQGAGHDARPFRLENARIEGALLTASKVYADGTTEPFEGAFLDRTSRSSPTEAGQTTFGLGVVLRAPVEHDGLTYQRLFYQLKP